MSLSPNEKYPGATEADPNYKDGKFKDNNPSTTNNGSPLKAIDRNEQLALQEAVMDAAGFEYNGTVDTPENSQMFAAYKAALSNGANLLSNHNFLIPSPDDSQPAPSATPTSYPPGYEIFSNVFANETSGISNLTYIDGRISFSGGDFYMSVPNSGGLERLTDFVASVADFDGKPRTRGVSFALVGDEYRVTVAVDALEDESSNATPLGSVKFEQGSVATGHEAGCLSVGNLGDYTDIVYKASAGASAVENMINGHPDTAKVGDSIRCENGTLFKRISNSNADINDFSLLSDVFIEDFGVVYDFVFDEDADTYSGTDNLAQLNAAQVVALAYGFNLIGKGKFWGISGKFTSEVPLILNGGTLCQLDRTSDTVEITKTGGVFEGTIYSNMSTGLAWKLSGSNQIFPGRNKVDLGSNLRVLNSFKVRPVGDYVGHSVLLEANSASEYLSGLSLDMVISGFMSGYKELTTGEAFINSNDVKLVMNSCLDYFEQESSLTQNKFFNIGQSYYSIMIQPQSGSRKALKLQSRDCTFEGQVWDAALFSDTSKVVEFVNVTPASPNQGFKTCTGNKVNMLGVNVDRCTGLVATNTVINVAGGNPSNIKDPLSNNTYQSKMNFRKQKLGVNGVEDQFNYLEQTDNFITAADKRFLTSMTATRFDGSLVSTILPSSGSEADMYRADDRVAVFNSSDFVTVSVSIKEGDFPEGSVDADFIGVKFLSPVDNVFLEVRFTGDSGYTVINDWQGSGKYWYSSRMNPKGGSTNQVRTQAIDGFRIRCQNASGVVEIENVFLMSPYGSGREMMNPYDAYIFEGSLNMAFSPAQGVLFKSPDGSIYKMVMKNGGVPDYELQ